jgi:tetratricopeptide (TPR) repeat protein
MWRRHAAFMSTLADEADAAIHGPQQLVWMDRLEAEHDKFRAALSWSLVHDPETALRLVSSLYWFWFYRGYVTESRDWNERALATTSGSPLLRARVLAWSSDLALHRSDNPTATVRAEEALDLARSTGDVASEGWALLILGAIASSTGNAKQAIAFSTEAETCFRRANVRHGMAQALFDQGTNAVSAGNYDEGQALMEQSLAESRAIGDRMGTAWTLSWLGHFALDHGYPGRAGTMLEEALTIAQEVRFGIVEAGTLLDLAHVARQQGDADQAERYFAQGETAFRDPLFRPLLADFLIQSGYLALRSGDHERARQRIEEALTAAREHSGPTGIAEVLHSFGDVLRASGDPGGAAEQYRDSLVLAQDIGDNALITACLTGLAGLALDGEMFEAAARLLGHVEMLRETVGQHGSSSFEEQVFTRDKARVREVLGGEADQEAREAGRALPVEAAVQEALMMADRVIANASSEPCALRS